MHPEADMAADGNAGCVPNRLEVSYLSQDNPLLVAASLRFWTTCGYGISVVICDIFDSVGPWERHAAAHGSPNGWPQSC